MTEARDENARTQTHFGYREVAPEEKTRLVRGVFSSVATRYDLMNDLMSGGVHRLWKTRFLQHLKPRPGERILDLAGGTGDIAFRILERTHGEAQVTIGDINPEMLAAGQQRPEAARWDAVLDWSCVDGQNLAFPDREFDAVTIAFGLRNFTDIEAGIAEAYRVLRPGGRYLILEFSRVALPLLADIYERYSFAVIPRLGQLVAGDRESYQYLVESIRRFPDQASLAGMMRAAGFELVRHTDLTGGIAAIHAGWRL
jgi:demethylmenaquinone methyltransferase/2-methoxy-6-polyprenyl-1,4-benzoquinol methylase